MTYRLVLCKADEDGTSSGWETVAEAETIAECVAVWEGWQNENCTEEQYEIQDEHYRILLTIHPECG